MNNLKPLLNELATKQTLCSVYSDPENQDSFSVGYIKWVGKEILLIESFLPNGKFDGFILRRLNDIILVETEGDYEIDILNKIHKQKSKNNRNPIEKVVDKIEDVLEILKEKDNVISIFYGEPEYK